MGEISLSSFVRGPKGDPGPAGPAGPTYEYVQTAPATQWVINHNLGFWPSVELRTVGGMEFDAEVLHMSNNQVIVLNTLPVAGTARLT